MAISESSIQQHLRLRLQTNGQIEIFQRFLESSGQGLAMADLEGQTFFANDTLCGILGEKHPEDLYERNIFSFYSPETAKRLQEEILPLVRQEGQWIGELALIDKLRHATPVIQNIFLLRDDAGKPLCLASVTTDISDRIRVEEELSVYRAHLELLVSNRTAELEKTNALLRAQIAERKLAEAECSRLAAVLENTSDLVAMMMPEGRIIYINEAGCRTVGWDGERKGDALKHNLAEVHPDWALRIVLEEGIPTATAIGVWRGETAVLAPDGREVPTSQVIMAHRGAGGEIEYLSTILRDISKSKQAQEALRASENRYHRLFESAQDGILILDEETGRIDDVNQFLKDMLGYAHEELIGKKLWEIGFFKDIEAAKGTFDQLKHQGYVRYEDLPFITKDGREIDIEFVSNVYQVNGQKVIQCNIRDITKRKQMEDKIFALTITDALTGLHNRRGFLSLAGQQLKLSDRHKRGVLLYFADLDGLKWINDTLGHEEGDKAIMEAAEVLKDTFRNSDIVARLGGDEYAVLAVDITKANAQIFTVRLQYLIDSRNSLENRRYRLSISVGCSYYDPENPCSLDELMVSADKLMYEQKKSKKSLLLQGSPFSIGSSYPSIQDE